MSNSEPKYKVLHELGAGGMGTVFKGLQCGQDGFQRPIVIKQVRIPDPAHVELLVEEAKRYAVLDHENIGGIVDFEIIGGERCIILEYIDGWSLVEFLGRHRELAQIPDVELCVFIASRVCRALQYVFEQSRIVHRDVSPSNIMMTREGTVKLIDFGIATRSGTRDEALAGKPAYMAPEMILETRADSRSDLFSLGAVLYELLTGERLFTGKSTTEVLQSVIAGHHVPPKSLNPKVPDAVTAILSRALQREPAQRYQTAAEMGEACEHFLYDKGYGPTNLSLKRYLQTLFPEADLELAEIPEADLLGPVDASFIPIDAGRVTVDPEGLTMAAPRRRLEDTGPKTRPPEDDPNSPPTKPSLRRSLTLED